MDDMQYLPKDDGTKASETSKLGELIKDYGARLTLSPELSVESHNIKMSIQALFLGSLRIQDNAQQLEKVMTYFNTIT